MMNIDQHIFALYVPGLHTAPIGSHVILRDKAIVTRLTMILRLGVDDPVILFDEQIRIDATLFSVDAKKNTVQCIVRSIHKHTPLTPSITLYQCITQKSAFEEIAYTATQLGVSRLVPVVSTKVQRKWSGDKEHERLTKIMIAAAEQSKQFVLPTIVQPVLFQNLIKKPLDGTSLFFSPSGESLVNLINKLPTNNTTQLNVLIGSEGGLTTQEEQKLIECSWKSYALTSMILRATDAVIVGLGSLRLVIK